MKNSYYIFIVFPYFLIAQSNAHQNKETVSVKNAKVMTIERQFSKPVVLAYQNQAIATIKDFYNYINLYKEAEQASALQMEIDQSIQNLFLNTAVSVKNIYNEETESIPLSQFLQCCKEKSISVLVSDFEENNAIADTYFTFHYKIDVTVNAKTVSYRINQKVYFFPTEKQFGSQLKNVWQLKLGEM